MHYNPKQIQSESVSHKMYSAAIGLLEKTEIAMTLVYHRNSKYLF